MNTRHSPSSRSALLLAIALAASASASHADGNAVAEQRLRAGVQQLVLDMASRGELADASGKLLPIQISEPSRDVDNLGVIIDSGATDTVSTGLAVLGVTPGSAAARMGVRSGDRLLEVNRQALSGAAVSASTAVTGLRDTVARVGDGGSIELVVDRDGRRIEMRGTLNRLRLPALHLRIGDGVPVASNGSVPVPAVAAGCGRISTFDVAPRQQQLHRAILIAVDGHSAGPDGSPSFRLSAGRHSLTVAEAIESRYLSFNDRQRNANRDRHKTIDVDVKADTTYFLAARLNADKVREWRDGAYWDPLLWKETSERCTP